MPLRSAAATCFALLSPLAFLACGKAEPSAVDWPHHGGQHDEAGYAAIGQIDAGNVSRLGLAWSLNLPGQQSLEATPLAVDGVIYFTGSYADVVAVSVETGKLLWQHEAKVYEHNPEKMNLIFRSTAVQLMLTAACSPPPPTAASLRSMPRPGGRSGASRPSAVTIAAM